MIICIFPAFICMWLMCKKKKDFYPTPEHFVTRIYLEAPPPSTPSDARTPNLNYLQAIYEAIKSA